jgi:hypothetical protein
MLNPLPAIVISSSRIEGVVLRARAWSSARRVRAAARRCRQLDLTLLMFGALHRRSVAVHL